MEHIWEKALSRAVFDEFAGKGVVIAGVGEDNIGAALVEGFHFLGSKVTAIGYDREPLDKLAEQLDAKKLTDVSSIHVISADLTVEQARKSAIDEACDVAPPVSFISTLGNDKRVKLRDLSQDQLRKLSLINWEVPILMGASFIEPVRNAGGGSICLFSSHHGFHLIDREMMAYGGSKAALDNAIVRLAHEAAEDNTPDNSVRVIGIRPGWVQSKPQMDRFPGAFADAARSQLIPSEMRPHDLVPQVVALVSRIFGGLTSGVTIPLDNGRAEGPVRNNVFPPRI